MRLATILCAAILVFATPRYSAGAASITVLNRDSAGEGFNAAGAPDGASAAGGNGGATLGEQRLIAFQYAANIWGNVLSSPVQIEVDANFDPMTCSANSALLGMTGPTTVHRDFVGAPLPVTWYPQALANSFAATDLAPGMSDIVARFSSSIGTTCAFPLAWYYGLDGQPPAGTIDFVTVVLHELGHGLGFLSLVDLATGSKFAGLNDVYMRNLENHSTGLIYPQMTDAQRVSASQNTGNLHWVGHEVMLNSGALSAGVSLSGHVEMYAPNPSEPGSSVSHFSQSLTPNQLMEPFYTGATHDVGLALKALADIGWNVAADSSADGGAPAVVSDLTATAASFTAINLSWTAPGDDANNGTAASYDLRYATSVINTKRWGAATPLAGLPAPSPAGSLESVTVSGLGCGKTYYFALETVDDVGNVSPMSNVATGSTLGCPTIALNNAGLPTGEVNVPYSATLDLVGGSPPYTVQVVRGGLPAGLFFDSATVQGTPEQSANAKLTVLITDQDGVTATKSLKLTILKPVSIVTSVLKAGLVGRAYGAALKPAGGMKPYSWSISAGTLPEGLDFDTTSGRIVGTPTSTGAFDLTIQLTDTLGGTTEKTLTLVIN